MRSSFLTTPSPCLRVDSRRCRTCRPWEVLAWQYDIVCNGIELSSGAVRNHRPDIMGRAFEIAGYPAERMEREFGAMLRAFRSGCPLHAGIASGIERT